MPFRYRIGAHDGTIVVTLSGEVTLDELQAGLVALTDDPAFTPSPRLVSDHRGIERAGTFDHVDAVLDHFRDHRARFSGARWAAVVSRPDSYGMMRVLTALAEMRNDMVVQLFDDYDEAVSWVLAPAGVSATR